MCMHFGSRETGRQNSNLVRRFICPNDSWPPHDRKKSNLIEEFGKDKAEAIFIPVSKAYNKASIKEIPTQLRFQIMQETIVPALEEGYNMTIDRFGIDNRDINGEHKWNNTKDNIEHAREAYKGKTLYQF